MKILVTGGCGFIGSNFIRRLLAEWPDATVVNLDKLTYAGNPENLLDLSTDPRYEFVRGDICDAELVDRLVSQGIHGIINFAAESHVDRSILDSRAFVETNVLGTQVLLEAAHRHRVNRFVQVSTDEVYGPAGPSVSFSEDASLNPTSPYAASKAAADHLVAAYHRTFGLPAIIIRCTNNYGPYQYPEKMIPLFITNALEDKPLPLYGDGLYRRDWVHVEDHCEALLLILQRAQPGRIYNIAGEQEWQNIDVAKLVLQYLDKPFDLIQHVKDRPAHDRRYAIDCSRIRNEFGWRPQRAFEEGLRDTVAWYREHASWWHRAKAGDFLEYYRRAYES